MLWVYSICTYWRLCPNTSSLCSALWRTYLTILPAKWPKACAGISSCNGYQGHISSVWWFCGKVHLQYFNVPIRKFASRADDHLETDVHPANSDMDTIDRHEAFRGPSVGIVPILVWYYLSFSTALVPQLQLWQLYWLSSIQPMGELVLQFLYHGYSAPIVEIHKCPNGSMKIT